MGIIEYYLPIEAVQIKFSTPNKNIINPKEMSIGRNENFTEINRVYIKCDTSKIPSNAIIKSAKMVVPIIAIQNDDGDNNAQMMGYVVTSTIANIDYVTWDNLPSINMGEVIFSSHIHENSLVEVDLTRFIKNFIDKSMSNNGFLFINNEAQHNEAKIDCNLLSRNGLSIRVRYYDPNERFYERNIDVVANSRSYYSESILASFLDGISVFVKNNGNSNIKASLEVSSNNIDFIEESSVEDLILNESKILVPYYNGKYIRVKLTTEDNIIDANVSVQAKLI